MYLDLYRLTRTSVQWNASFERNHPPDSECNANDTGHEQYCDEEVVGLGFSWNWKKKKLKKMIANAEKNFNSNLHYFADSLYL